jgi:hypothetical protein
MLAGTTEAHAGADGRADASVRAAVAGPRAKRANAIMCHAAAGIRRRGRQATLPAARAGLAGRTGGRAQLLLSAPTRANVQKRSRSIPSKRVYYYDAWTKREVVESDTICRREL